MTEKTRVVVAMSGGVDSSVTAALLLEKGYDVIGVTMQIWEPGPGQAAGDFTGCCSLSAVEDARRVADKLGIPYYVMNFRSVFQEKVIEYFAAEYLQGRTPNPCIACNRYVKFQALLDKSLGLGAEFVATGHYARLEFSREYGRYTVRRPADRKKDQTYVLYGLTQNQIAHTLMPLGDFTKEKVRDLAGELGLAVARKPESQDICFVHDDNYRAFLQERTSNIRPGAFLNMKGEVIGQHQGIPFYTIGQRKGLGLALGKRMYVLNIDPDNNTITLGPEEAILGSDLVGEDLNIILYESLSEPLEVDAQVRYNGRPSPALLTPLPGGEVGVNFYEPQRSITPGQAVVFYKGDYLVGGATIKSASRHEFK